MTRRLVDPAAFGAVLAALWAAHDLADHVVQTDHQAAGKAARYGWAMPMAEHVAGYHAVQLAALAALRSLAGVRPSWRRTLAGVALSAGTHALLDRRWPVVAILRATGSPGFARSNVVSVHHDVDGFGRASTGGGVPHSVEAIGLLPLHGPYLADQALHHACLAVTAAIISGSTR